MGLGAELRTDLDGMPRIRAAFPECTANLRFEDFHPRYDYHALVDAHYNQDSTAYHFEVAGRMTGEVRLGNRTLRVNALGYRDRSWGPRTWGTLRSTRWWPCVFGPDLSLHILHVRGYTAVEGIGEVRLGDRVGMSNMEVCTNPAGGSKPPVYGIGSFVGEGISKR